MRLGQVIGRVTLHSGDPAFHAGRFLLVQPLSKEQVHAQSKGQAPDRLAKGNSLVVYDQIGAGSGDIIGYVEGREATAPFDDPVPPIDALNCSILDTVFHNPPA